MDRDRETDALSTPAGGVPTRLTRFGAVDRAGDPAEFLRFLDRVRALPGTSQAKRARLNALRLAPGDTVIEVGCGTGEDTQQLASRVGRSGRAVGVDISEYLIGEARARAAHAGSTAEFVVADAGSIPLPDASADAYYAERVYQHLPRPGEALAEAMRVLRASGRVTVADQDWETLIIDAGDRSVTRAIATAVCDSITNGWMGRRLPGLFRQYGLSDISIHPSTMLFDDLAIVVPLILGTAVQAALDADAVTQEQAEAWLGDLRQRDADGRFLCGFTFYEVRGIRP